MDIIWNLIIVVLGAFILFYATLVAFRKLNGRSFAAWLLCIFMLAVANMVIHRIAGSSINPPFFTALLFVISLHGNSAVYGPLVKPGSYAALAGTIIGWLSYIQTGSA